ncbi:putative rRNA methylase [Nymphaea thermarum]|nr:putative rRNA methylase [Nymphaea thermarum]
MDEGGVGHRQPCLKMVGHDLGVWQHIVRKGDTAIDATCGNGFDTLALLKMVSDESRNGCVLGFDVQQSALDSTSSLLNQSVDPIQKEQVKLFLMCHSRMQDVVPEGKSIRLIAFNLGYLPRGDKTITTVPETTFQALQSATEILDSGGLISIIAYVGHPGGSTQEVPGTVPAPVSYLTGTAVEADGLGPWVSNQGALEERLSILFSLKSILPRRSSYVVVSEPCHDVREVGKLKRSECDAEFLLLLIHMRGEEWEAVQALISSLPICTWVSSKFEVLNRPKSPILALLFKK